MTEDGPSIRGGGGSTTVRIGDADLDGVVVKIRNAGCLKGQVHTDGIPLPSFFWFHLTSIDKNLDSNISNMAIDGTIRLDNLMPGDYRISGLQIPESWYLKSAMFDGTDVLAHPLHFDVLAIEVCHGHSDWTVVVMVARPLRIAIVAWHCDASQLATINFSKTQQSGVFSWNLRIDRCVIQAPAMTLPTVGFQIRDLW